MVLLTIFCPQCDTLLLEADQCPGCGWRRPLVGGQTGQPVWAVALETKLPRQGVRPIAAGGVAYLPTDQNQIVALDTSKARTDEVIKWRYHFDHRYRGYSLAVWEEQVLLGTEYTGSFPTPQGALIVLSVQSGDEVWRMPVDGVSLSVPVVQHDTAYFTVDTGWLYAVDLTRRRELWRREIPMPWSWAPAAPLLTPTGLLVLPSRNDQLVACQVTQKEISWTFSAEGWFPHTPVWYGGTVYARCWDRHIYALEAASGKEIWRFKAPRDFSSDIWVDSAHLYVGVKDYQDEVGAGSRAYALYVLDRQTGRRVERHEVQGHLEARPVTIDHTLFFASADRSPETDHQGSLYALDQSSQELLWPPLCVEQRFQSDLLLVDDLLIAGTRQGAVYAIRWREAAKPLEPPQVYVERAEWAQAAVAYAYQDKYSEAAEIYEQELGQPFRAGQLYLRAGKYHRVIELLGSSEVKIERDLAITAAEAVPDANDRAEVLRDLGEHLKAARVYLDIEDWLRAGVCFEAAQAWAEARAVYVQANAWDKWEKVTRELKLWDELAERFLQMGEYVQAAELYLERGIFRKAADCYYRANLRAEALEAYSQVSPAEMTETMQQRLAELAEAAGKIDLALEAYKAIDEWAKAAPLAEISGDYEQALTLYQKAGYETKAVEMLRKLACYVKAAELCEQALRWGRAADNWVRQVEHEIKSAGGVRHARKNRQVEAWLLRAIKAFEKEADEAESPDQIDYYYECADRCRVKLMQIRSEPLLRLNLQADRLLSNQGNAIHYVVENVGWGTAEKLTLAIGGSFLRPIEPLKLGSLGRRRKLEGKLTVVPEIVGEVTLMVELKGQSKCGALRESLAETVPVVQNDEWLANLVTEAGQRVTLNIQNYIGLGPKSRPIKELAINDRDTLWEEDGSTPTGELDSGVVSQDELNRQFVDQIGSLQRQLMQRSANLNKLRERASYYGVTDIPLALQNQIEAEQQSITELEMKLNELQG